MPMPLDKPRGLEAKTFSVEDLLGKVRGGEIRMPKFQRRLQWQATDVRLLLDSLIRGFPVGTLLFWDREGADAGEVRFGPMLVQVAAASRAWWVIDGQHRIAALATTLMMVPDQLWGIDSRFGWYWDLRTEQFRGRPSRGEQAPAHWLPLYCVGDMVRLMEWGDRLRAEGGSPADIEKARRWARIILDYKLTAYVIDTDSEDVVRLIFDRVNSAGKKLSPEDVFGGLYAYKGDKGFSLEALRDSLSEVGFGEFEPRRLLRMILGVQDKDLTKPLEAIHALGDDVERAVEATGEAMLRVIEFLRDDAGFPHASLVPYELPVIVLARFFHLWPKPLARSRTLLRRWVWRGAATGQHIGGGAVIIRNLLRALQPGDEEGSIQRLLAVQTLARPALTLSYRFDPRSARGKLQVLALLRRQPRHCVTGELLDIDDLLRCDGLDDLLKIRVDPNPAGDDSDLHNSLANRILHPSLEGGPDPFLHTQAEAVCASHFLTRADLDAARRGEMGEVLKRRHASLTSELIDLVDANAEWEQSDRQSLDSLLTLDDEEAA